METLPPASGQDQPPQCSFPLCGLCNALPRQWGLLGRLAWGGEDRQKPTLHPSNQQLATHNTAHCAHAQERKTLKASPLGWWLKLWLGVEATP